MLILKIKHQLIFGIYSRITINLRTATVLIFLHLKNLLKTKKYKRNFL